MYRVINLLDNTEVELPDAEALWRHAQLDHPWALLPPPADAHELAERLDASQLLSVEVEPEGPQQDEEVPESPLWRAAGLRAGTVPPDDAYANAAVAYEGEATQAALAAAGLDPDDEALREQVRTLALTLAPTPTLKAEGEDQPMPEDTEILPVSANAGPVAKVLVEAARARGVMPFVAAGKHSAGMWLAQTSTGTILLKPGSGKHSPIRGVGENPASQAQREVAVAAALDVLGLARYAVRADLVLVAGRPTAALEFLPEGKDLYRPLGKAIRADRAGTQLRLLPLLAAGTLHRLALALYVLGEGDGHNGNVYTSKDDPLRLIDHGSALAGPSFSPATDPKAFCPAFLRAWAPGRWALLSPEAREAALPRLSAMAENEVRGWWAGVDRAALQVALESNGATSEAVLARCALVSTLATTDRFDSLVNRLWSQGGVG